MQCDNGKIQFHLTIKGFLSVCESALCIVNVVFYFECFFFFIILSKLPFILTVNLAMSCRANIIKPQFLKCKQNVKKIFASIKCVNTMSQGGREGKILRPRE